MSDTYTPRGLTSRQFDVMCDLRDREPGEWLRPMDIGGHNGSDHSAILRQLECKGVVESKRRPGAGMGGRGSKVYRLNESYDA